MAISYGIYLLRTSPAHLDGYIDRLKELRALREAAVSAEWFLGDLATAVPARIPAALAELEARLAGAAASIEPRC